MLPPSPHDPFKPPDWRWLRARWLREKGRYARRNADDPATFAAKKFQADSDRVKDDLDEARLAGRDPALYHAVRIHQREDLDTRWSLEARVLGRQDPADIARKCRTTPEVVRWYESLFFDVRTDLPHTDYVCNVVMGRSIHMGLAERHYDLLWKLYGYLLGPVVLDSLITKFTNPVFITSPEEIDAALAQSHRSTLVRKAHMSSLTQPVAYNQMIIMEAHARLLDIEKNASGAGGGESLLKQNVAAMLSSLRFSVATAAVDVPRLAHYDGLQMEPRAGELVAVALGAAPSSPGEVFDQNPFAGVTKDGQPDQQGH